MVTPNITKVNGLKKVTLFFVISYLAGCAINPIESADMAEIEDKNAQTTTSQEKQASKPEEPATVADRPFTVDTLYALLVAEMAIDRRRYDIALSNYMQQAISTRDLMVTSRATQLARSLNARQSALELSQLWLDIAPYDSDARLIASIELIENNYLLEAFELSRQMLHKGETTAFESIAMKAEKGDITIVKELARQYAQLLERYNEDAGLWLGQSILLLQAGEHEAALAAAERAKALDGDSIRSAFQETRVLHKMGRNDLARERLSQLVAAHPDNIGLRARYARIVWSSAPEEALEQFKILHQQSPHDPEILYSLGLVEKDLGYLDDAKARFQELLVRNQYPDAAHYHLGDIHEKKNEIDRALEHFTRVGLGQSYISALVKATDILVNRNDRDGAVELVKERQVGADGQVLESLFMLEADIYSQGSQMENAQRALTRGVENFPDSTRLLYARALLYAQLDNIAGAERDLKRILELVPENAAALNALGYTLADRTDRYEEAYAYIKQAYALTPDDPAVIDSMGWVAYRLGNYEEALEQLTRAMEKMPDHEIAAHLGEVLWVTGEYEKAMAIWRQGLELNPQSAIILRTMQRLEANLN